METTTVFDYLLENNIVDDKKEFVDLHSVRAILVNNAPLSDPQMDINEVETIKIGSRLFTV